METTNGLIEELESVLSRNVQLYGEMEKALIAERAALESASYVRIESSVSAKSTLVFQIKSLEERRRSIIAGLSSATGVAATDLKMDKIISLAPAKLKNRFQTIRAQLREKYENTNEMNKLNRGIIEKLIGLNHATASTLQNLLRPESTYQRAGATRSTFRSGQVVSRTL